MSLTRRALLTHVGAAATFGAAAPSLLAFDAALARRAPAPGGSSGSVRLHCNENAYGPSPRAIAAAQEAVRDARYYPDAASAQLRSRIARLHGVAPEQVVLGCGSTEILRMAVDSCVGPHRQLVVARPTVDWITDYARQIGATVAAIPLTADYSHDLTAMLAGCVEATGMAYICNPNNPTGTLTRRRDVEAFVRNRPRSAYVLIDEAYHHYAGESSDYVSFIDRPVDDPRVIVSRSFSKMHGLAGLRVGYAVCTAETARLLQTSQLAHGLNSAAAEAALASLEDTDHLRTCAQLNTDDRQEFLNQANARMLRVIDSQTNFIMVNTEVPAAQVVDHFKRSNVLIAGPVPGFETHVRVSLGTPTQMHDFWSIWDQMPAHHMMSGHAEMLRD